MTESKLTGVELTARAMGACGREVKQSPRIYPSVGRPFHLDGWCWKSGSHRNSWHQIPDWTRPEALHEVVAMAREAFPNETITIRYRAEPLNNWWAMISPDNKGNDGVSDNPCIAMLESVCRAGGVEVGE